jgi:glycosyltransferase involved in cell wall biosynthesis
MKAQNMQLNRVLYICNLLNDAIVRERALRPASSVCAGRLIPTMQACRREGLHVWALSMGRNRQQGTLRWFRTHVTKTDGIPVVHATFWDCPVLTHFVTAISLGLIVWRLRRRTASCVYWNAQPHSVLALLSARTAKIRIVLDLEDGARDDIRGLAGWMQRNLLKLWDRFADAAMVANRQLLSQIATRPVCVYYGTAPEVHVDRDWSGTIQGLYSGYLAHDTGADNLLDALRILKSEFPDSCAKLRIVAVGHGPAAELLRSAAGAELYGLLEFRGLVDDGAYKQLLRRAHFGLSLKIPESAIGKSTFPSKVIDLARHGLLVVSHRVSDVAEVLPEHCALLLRNARCEDLVSALRWIADAPTEARTRAENGQNAISRALSPKKVAPKMADLWLGNDAAQIGSKVVAAFTTAEGTGPATP